MLYETVFLTNLLRNFAFSKLCIVKGNISIPQTVVIQQIMSYRCTLENKVVVVSFSVNPVKYDWLQLKTNNIY